MVLVNELYPSECISNRTALNTSNPKFRLKGDPLLSTPNESRGGKSAIPSPPAKEASPIPVVRRESNDPSPVVAAGLSSPGASPEEYGDDLTSVIKNVKETAMLVS